MEDTKFSLFSNEMTEIKRIFKALLLIREHRKISK